LLGSPGRTRRGGGDLAIYDREIPGKKVGHMKSPASQVFIPQENARPPAQLTTTPDLVALAPGLWPRR
jgi:hypothetical protein